MRESESFDAFYARTVADVTNRMHALADGDPQADHAIREAYARAYQQWFEVSGFRDADGWVLDAAKDAFERRRAQAGLAPAPAPAPARDSGSWPNMYREPHVPRQAPPADPDATVAPLASQPQAAPVDISPPVRTAGGLGRGETYAEPDTYEPYDEPQRSTGPSGPGRGRDRKALIAGITAVALVLVSAVAYLEFGRGHSNSPAAGTSAGAHAKKAAAPHALKAGQVGQLSAVPWSLVRTGWTLAELSGAGGSVTTFLVDPAGGRYNVAVTGNATLVAWSGNKAAALFATSSGSGTSYSLLALRTTPSLPLRPGTIAHLSLPANVTVTGFTQPEGLNLIAVQRGPARYKLQRYNLQGALQATLSSLALRPAVTVWAAACGPTCGAISSPDGDTAVWGITGDEMQLVDNAGGLIRRLHVPQSGSPPSCAPLGWWSSTEVLASCAVAAQPGASRLWLVPANGSPATPLTVASGSSAGAGVYTGAWQVDGKVYVTATSPAHCASAPSGPGSGRGILAATSTSGTPVTVQGTTGNYNGVVGSYNGQLLVIAQTGCTPESSSLMLFNPSSSSTQSLLSAPSGTAGVVAAVAYGSG
jgi:hypothetical protein